MIYRIGKTPFLCELFCLKLDSVDRPFITDKPTCTLVDDLPHAFFGIHRMLSILHCLDILAILLKLIWAYRMFFQIPFHLTLFLLIWCLHHTGHSCSPIKWHVCVKTFAFDVPASYKTHLSDTQSYSLAFFQNWHLSSLRKTWHAHSAWFDEVSQNKNLKFYFFSW